MTDELRSAPPREGYRAISTAPVFREDAEAAPRLVGHFARFNTFNEIDSAVEGRFLERITPGAFRKTFNDQGDRIRVLFQHGRDPDLGDKPIAAPRELREDEVGPYYEAELLDGLPPLVLDGLRKGQYGVSYRFQVVREDWDPNPKKSDTNPNRLPERTIREARVFEFGPVTFPADAGADVMVRSLSDQMTPPAEVRATDPEPEAPSLDAEAPEPHLELERRDEPVEVAAIQPKEITTVEYVSVDEKRARDREITDELTRTATEYTGVLPPDVQERWDGLVAEQDRLRADIAAYEARMARIGEAAAKPQNTERAYDPPTIIRTKSETDIFDIGALRNEARTAEAYDQKLRDNAMRAVEIATMPSTTDADEGRTHVARLLDTRDSENKELARRILVTGSPLYRRAFNKYVQGVPLSPEEQRGTALAVQVDGTGGYALPFAFDPTIIPIGSHSGWQNPYRQFARVETIVGTDTWQGLTSTAVVATRADEAAAATEQGPTFAQPSALVTRVQGAVTYSIEMASDRPDIGAELAVLIAEAKDNEEEAAFSTGVGDALGSKVNPLGIFAAHGTSGAYTHIDLATAHTLAIGDLDALEAAVPVRHRARSVWLMNERTLRSVQGLETTGGRLFNGGNYPAVGPVGFNPTGNTGLRLLNKPVYITPSATYDVTVDDTPLMWLGAGDSYLVLDRAGINVEYIPHVFADASGSLPTGQRRLYFWYRNTAKPINTDGGRILMVKNS